MNDTLDALYIRSWRDIRRAKKLPAGTLIEGFDGSGSGGYWYRDPTELVKAAAKLILKHKKENQPPCFYSQAAIVLYAVEKYDLHSLRTHYKSLNHQTWKERIEKYQHPKNEREAYQIARSLSSRDYKEQQGEQADLTFEDFLKLPKQQKILEERIRRFSEEGLSKEEALKLAPDPGVSDAGAGLFRGADLPPLEYRRPSWLEAYRDRQHAKEALKENGSAKVASLKEFRKPKLDTELTKQTGQIWRAREEARRTAPSNHMKSGCMMGM